MTVQTHLQISFRDSGVKGLIIKPYDGKILFYVQFNKRFGDNFFISVKITGFNLEIDKHNYKTFVAGVL